LNAPLQKLYGVSLPFVFIKTPDQYPMTNSGDGSLVLFQGVKNCICLVYLPYVGQFGNVGTRHALKRK
jgi:hypothetical protein